MSRQRSSERNSVSHLDEARFHVHPAVQPQVFRKSMVFDGSGTLGAVTLDADTSQSIAMLTAFPGCGLPTSQVIVGWPYYRAFFDFNEIGDLTGLLMVVGCAAAVQGTSLTPLSDPNGFFESTEILDEDKNGIEITYPTAALFQPRLYSTFDLTFQLDSTGENIADIVGVIEIGFTYWLLPHRRPQS